ncbi:MAG: ABC transporter substrate-binding protein/permease [Vicinamibacterales bacterium]
MTRRTLIVVSLAAMLAPAPSLRAQAAVELRWGGDAEGGAPFVSADPLDASRVVGFEADIAALLAAGLGRTPRFVQSGFTTLDAAVLRGDFDVILSGIEDLPSRRARLALTIPYYEFDERLTVRASDAGRYRTLADLRGRRVGTLAATLAAEVLRRAQAEHGVVPVLYEDDVHPYEDLALGRVDAVVLDQVLAERAVSRTVGLLNQPARLASGHYVGGFAPAQAVLRDRANEILRTAMRDGRLQRIFERYGMWTPGVAALYAREAGRAAPADGAPDGASAAVHQPVDAMTALRAYLPGLFRAALVTLALSCLAMLCAVALGGLIAAGRVYGGAALRAALGVYVEVVRGTPLLLQLFVIYFGLAAVVRLPAFLAALVGLALNYAAYESEIHRGALLAVPAGQLDAARALGLSDLQTLRFVRGPQALRLALAPMTNDFIALLKDSSLVSVITVVELTKATSIFASDIGSWVVPGLVCAVMYLALSLPLAHLARRLERRWSRA